MKFKKGDDEASFFKILLRDDAEYLPLPSVFAKKYLEKGDNKKQNIILQNQSCSKWSVEYIRIEDRYYFMGGWLTFTKENHLQVGDFLVFWLLSRDHSNPVFQVFIYSPNGSLRCTASGSGNTQPVDITAAECEGKKSSMVESMSDDDDESSEDDAAADDGKKPSSVESMSDDESSEYVARRSLTRVLCKSYKHRMPLTNSFVNASGITGYNTLKLKNNRGNIWEVKLTMLVSGTAPFITWGWYKFLKDNKLKMGEMCKFDHVKGNLLHVFVSKNKKDHEPSVCVLKKKKNHESSVCVMKKKKDHELSKNTRRSFTRVVRKTSIHRMTLSKKFMKATGISNHNMLRLKNNNGKMWEVEVSMHLAGRGRVRVPSMTRGLLKFLKDNKIKTGDLCKFDHVKGNLLHVCVLNKKNDV